MSINNDFLTVLCKWPTHNGQPTHVSQLCLLSDLSGKYSLLCHLWHFRLTRCLFKLVKVLSYALGPELIPVYRRSAHKWLLWHSPAGIGCHYFLLGLRHLPRRKTSLSLPKVVTQLCPDWKLYDLFLFQVQRLTSYTPLIHPLILTFIQYSNIIQWLVVFHSLCSCHSV